MRKNLVTSGLTANYRWVERNITKHGGSYRVKVGPVQRYVATRSEARVIKRQLLNKS